MRAILFVLFLFTISSMFGQIPYDTIWAVNGQPIICTIVKEKKNYVTYFPVGETESKMLPKPQMDRYTRIDPKTSEFSAVTEASGTKGELFSRARLILSDMFKDSREAIELEDREGGIIQMTGWTADTYSKTTHYWFTMTLKFRDGRYKMTLSNMYLFLDANPPQKMTLDMHGGKNAGSCYRDVRRMCDRFHAAMQVSNDGEEDW